MIGKHENMDGIKMIHKSFQIKRLYFTFDISNINKWKFGFYIYQDNYTCAYYNKKFYKTKDFVLVLGLFYNFVFSVCYITKEETKNEVMNIKRCE